MGAEKSKETEATGNSNASSITIIEQLQSHSETLTIFFSNNSDYFTNKFNI